MRKKLALVCLSLWLTACATPQMASLQQRWPEALPASATVADVPFYPQDDYQCGPAALAMAAGAAGTQLRPEDLVEQVYLPARQGSLQLEMLAVGRRYGLLSYQLKPGVENLLQEVAAGNPAIVLQNLSFSFSPVWHYAVVTGFDRSRNMLRLHSGRTRDMEMSLYTFERTWARADQWAMLLLPPTRLPATADAPSYAAAAALLELTAPKAAQTAYATGLRKWPGQSTLMLGAGNMAYALGSLDAAVAAYRQLTKLHPASADGWNNLAQALLDQGKKKEAAVAIQRAVVLGGARLPRYLELQNEIQGRR
ncbi:PA2778 family cysteine peptidase [Noviherbaspirillum sedimenti]|uniref:Tetratricopeptide repeat protein n=1 Tax=Noviherbaspirillum sedimenti TaxID=2320865 RepID=A0A3A3GSD2_9BURK|nr:PA2778 family cysteine peptidase [Noviherbaspirillum sedimenti]RJG03890.1 tetratricopeptide repeat protein [Noviherbaspirillum sedimenti]